MSEFASVFFIIDDLSGGGAEKVITVLANQFHRFGFNVTVVQLNPHRIASSYPLDPKIRTIVLSKKKSPRVIRILTNLIILRNYIKKENPNYIIPFMMHVIIQTLFAGFNTLSAASGFFESFKLPSKVYQYRRSGLSEERRFRYGALEETGEVITFENPANPEYHSTGKASARSEKKLF